MRLLILAALIAFQGAPSSRPPRKELTVAEVLNRWETGADLIDSYDLRLELTQRLLLEDGNGKKRLLPEKDAIKLPTLYSRIYRKEAKRRGEFQGDGHGHYGPPIIWDGKLGSLFQPGRDAVNLTPHIISFGGSQYEDYEATYHMVGGTTDRIELSRQRESKLLPRDGRLFVLDVPTTSPGPFFYSAHWRVWLDPDRNFMPVKLVQWLLKGAAEAHSLDIENELSEVAPGVWAPVSSLIRVFYKDEKSPFHGKNTFFCRLSVIKDQSRFNVDVADSLFEIRIPNGMTVIDRARNAVYTQGSDNADDYLRQLAKDETKKLAGLSPEDRSPPATIFVPSDDRRIWYWSVLFGIAVLVLAGAIYAARRKRVSEA